MKSKILSIALIATLTACVLTACGDKTSETSVSSVASTNIGSDESRSDEEVAKEIKTSDAYEVSEVKESSDESSEETASNPIVTGALNLGLEGSILYDKDGVLLSLESVRTDDFKQFLIFDLILTNDSDNKLAYVSIADINVNGVPFDKFVQKVSGSLNSDSDLSLKGLNAGETLTIELECSLDNTFDKVFAAYCDNDKEINVTSIGFDFSVKVGSDAALEYFSPVFGMADDTSMYGEYIGTIDVPGVIPAENSVEEAQFTVDVYTKQTSDNVVITCVKHDMFQVSPSTPAKITLNGKELDNDKLLASSLSYGDDVYAICLKKGIDDLKKENEISSDSDLALQLVFKYKVFTSMTSWDDVENVLDITMK